MTLGNDFNDFHFFAILPKVNIRILSNFSNEFNELIYLISYINSYCTTLDISVNLSCGHVFMR